MTSPRQRLILLRSAGRLTNTQRTSLQQVFDLIEIDNLSDAREHLDEDPTALVLAPAAGDETTDAALSPVEALQVLEHIGEGVGVVDADSRLTWSNAGLTDEQPVRRRFIELCRQAIDIFNRPAELSVPAVERSTRKFELQTDDRTYELFVSPAAASAENEQHVHSVVGVLCDITAARRLQQQIDAINTAGSELMKIEVSSITQLDAPQRLKLLEDKIVGYVKDLLHFDNFEIRLLDRESDELKLVISRGLNPLKIGEVLYARPEGNGICGYVASTSQSYLCRDVRRDPRYREGLDDAASSLTVPLKLHDRTIGVFNVESNQPDAFDENDLRFAEIFARYVAMAMNILDLLVVERFTTNEEISSTFLEELREPLSTIADAADRLESQLSDNESLRGDLEKLITAARNARQRAEQASLGPRTILAAERELHREEPDPQMIGKRVLIADDEANIREKLAEILRQRGCDVVTCSDGGETIETIELAEQRGESFDLIISDINMPQRNGYEVFRSAKAVNPDTPIMLMTGFGYDPHHSIMRASQEGLHCFLFKPLRASQLIAEVAKAFEDSSVNSNQGSE